MRALVTGGAGFIGSVVADRMLHDGWEVTAFDSFDPYYDPAQKRRNVARALERPGYRLIVGDVREPAAVEAAFETASPEVVVHLAARAGIRPSVDDPLSYLTTNEIGALHVLEACRRRERTPLVLASTSSIYGGGATPPFREDDPRATPLSPYAATKRASELMALTYHHLHALPLAILRFFTVYGPRGRPDMAFWLFTHALRHGEPIRLRGRNTKRDFTFVRDIANGVLGAARWVYAERGAGVFNLGGSEPHRVIDVVEGLASRLGVDSRIELAELHASECEITAADCTRAQTTFGFQPETSLDAGIDAWMAWVDGSDEAPAALRPGAAS
ncbi:MAG: GDP-mannose 4,6-dehydratase [Polyangiaceae bacterium]|nr:GDP-mannose 4,6-dehydratase [Polyangiaceae bacterium]